MRMSRCPIICISAGRLTPRRTISVANVCRNRCGLTLLVQPAARAISRFAEQPRRPVYIAFDQDQNQAGQNAAYDLLQYLDKAGLNVRLVDLPAGHDPNSYFTSGATAQDFARLLEEATSL